MKIRWVIFLALIFQGHSILTQSIYGVNLVGPFQEQLNATTIGDIKDLNANWISLTPEAEWNRRSLQLAEAQNNLNWAHNYEGYKKIILEAKSQGLKIVLKPHVIIAKDYSKEDRIKHSTTWRGELEPYVQEDWKIAEEEYRSYILKYARLARDLDVDLFIIGTELKSFVDRRPLFWKALIKELRTVYDGPLSYSANWDNFENIPFWSDLNLISLNAYFPISDEALPKVATVKKKWKKIEKTLERFAHQHKKKVIFSELGYRSRSYSGKEPWLHLNQTPDAEISHEAQYNLYKALFDSIWRSEVVLGGFIWNWEQVHLNKKNSDFSIRNKPVESLVREVFGQ